MRRVLIIDSLLSVIILLLTNLAVSAHAEEATLCRDHEEVYFSCSVGKRIISLCACGNISPDKGYVRYRFGTSERVELQFPDVNQSSKDRFFISDISGGNLSFTHVKFKSGGYDYVIFEGILNGLYVKKDGKNIVRLACDPGIYQRLSQRAYRGIETVPPVEGIDD